VKIAGRIKHGAGGGLFLVVKIVEPYAVPVKQLVELTTAQAVAYIKLQKVSDPVSKNSFLLCR